MTNAYIEMIEILDEIDKKIDDIKIVYVWHETFYEIDKRYNTVDSLKELYYDSGYGIQEVFGYIIFKDNTWLERHEYDGSEWWEYKDINKIFERIGKLKCKNGVWKDE